MIQDASRESNRLVQARFLEGRMTEITDFKTGAAEKLIAYLVSDRALQSIEQDPYWPKWDSPWWHMTLLWELGLVKRIPAVIVKHMIRALNTHYERFLPIKIEEIPAGRDKIRHFPCHCGLGTMYRVLFSYGVDVDFELPWIRPWFLRYQLPDGGLNCDEKVYMKPNPKSSIVSTLPPLEAVLLCTPRPFTQEENIFLDRGAEYLIAHKLFRSANRDGKIINENWLKLCLPRFYEYDILRGLTFLVKWAKVRGKPVPINAISETLEILNGRFPNGQIIIERLVWKGGKTLAIDSGGNWGMGHPASEFDLLSQVSQLGKPSEHLSRFWQESKGSG